MDSNANSEARVVLAACGCCGDGRLGLGEAVASSARGCVDVVTVLPWSTHADAPVIRKIACGGYHNLALAQDGGVYGWGANDQGQLGCNGAACVTSPQRITFFDALRTARDGEHADGADVVPQGRTQAPQHAKNMKMEEESVVEIAAGGLHSLVRTTRGIYVAGANTFGQLGLGEAHGEHCVRRWRLLCSLPQRLVHLGEAEYAGLPTRSSRGMASMTTVHNSRATRSEEEDDVMVEVEEEEELVHGDVTHMSCGTHHTLLAWKNCVVRVVKPAPDGASASETVTYVFYPVLLTACGKGDFGELGYDADTWAVLRSKNQRVQAAALASAERQERQQQTPASHTEAHELSAVVPPTVAPTQTPCYSFAQKWKSKVERRPEFFSCSHRKVRHLPPVEETAVHLDNAEGEEAAAAAALATLSSPGAVVVEKLCAEHLHSCVTFSLRGRGGGDETWHWGCYYNGRVEDKHASRPRRALALHGQAHPADTAAALEDEKGMAGSWCVHAGNELLLRFASPGAAAVPGAVSPWGVVGVGNLGLGEEEDEKAMWVPLPVPAPPCTASSDGTDGVLSWRVARVVGRDHILALFRSLSDGMRVADEQDMLCGFGSNLYGELGQSVDTGDASEGTDACVRPICVLSCGACVVAPPAKEGKDRLSTVSRTYRVQNIIDVGAGARHTVLLLRVLEEPSSSP